MAHSLGRAETVSKQHSVIVACGMWIYANNSLKGNSNNFELFSEKKYKKTVDNVDTFVLNTLVMKDINNRICPRILNLTICSKKTKQKVINLWQLQKISYFMSKCSKTML